jgi:glycosyltransferase involved in cell wall biosynthesis
MEIAFIHNEKKITTGAHHINDLISRKLQERGVHIKHFYPKQRLSDIPTALRGIQNILFFHSLLVRKGDFLRSNLIQGTTYTPLAFLPFATPVVTHFGSTTHGFIKATPLFSEIEKPLQKIWRELRKSHVITEFNIKTRQPLRDIAEIEIYVAKRAKAVIATSEIVRNDLLKNGVDNKKISVIHNAIEDFWFKGRTSPVIPEKPHIVYIGRLGSDTFTLKLKGLDRLIYLYQSFPHLPKITIGMTKSKYLIRWCKKELKNHTFIPNVERADMQKTIEPLYGSICISPSRYEGFCLSMVEAMSQGLVPVTFSTGVAPEIIRNGYNGFIVSSLEEMNEKVRLLTEDDDLRIRIAAKAQATAQQFTADIRADRLLCLYKKIILE